MSHSVADLYAETIRIPATKLEGRMYYVTAETEKAERQSELDRLNETYLARMTALQAGGWRKWRRLFIDAEFRNREVVVHVPGWVAGVLSSLKLDKRGRR